MKNLLTLLASLLCLSSLKAQSYVTISDTSFVSWLQLNIPAAMSGNQLDTIHADVTSRKQISIQNKHIVNLNGIQYFDSLKTLNCSVNVYDTLDLRISNLPALPGMLDTLICDGNKLDSLPVLPTGLLYLSCSQNSLDSLPVIPNTVKFLECWGNQLTGLPVLPDSLKSFNCCNNSIYTMPNLPIGLLTFTCSSNQLHSLPALPDSLTSLNCSINPILNLPPFPNSLVYLDCSGDSLVALPTLPNNLIDLLCHNNYLTALPALPTTLNFMDCSFNQLAALPTLVNSLHIINCSSNNLTALPTLPNALYKLICSSNPLPALPTLPNTLAILYCDNDVLTVLPALPNSLIELDCSTNPLNNLPALPGALNILDCHSDLLTLLPALPNSLGSLYCFSNQLTTLPALPNSLYNLNCNANVIIALPVIPASLGVLTCNSNQLTSLPILPPSLAFLDCSYNNIQCFEPFHQIPGYFNIQHNPFTCIPNYIPTMDSITLRYPLCTAGNPFNCPSSYGIVGFTYKDNNHDCIKDSLDGNLKNIPMRIYDSGSNLLGTTYTAMNGVYQFLDSASTYTVMVDTVGKPYNATCIYPGLDSTLTVAVLDTNVNFALACKAGFDIGVQSVGTCGIVFPGQTHVMRVNAGDLSKWYNLNCASGISGTLVFTITGPVTYIGPATGALTPVVTGNIYSYAISDFATINNSTDFGILLQPFPTAQAGDPICVTAKISPVSGDNYPSNNDYVACYNVVNSHDPNVKETYPINVMPGFSDWLTYTIHFQNTGNAPAFNILLKDTLDSELDLSTFQVTDYSHANTVHLDGNILSVYYANIMLPDSTTGGDSSIGFVQYRLKPKTTWARPHQIKNTAYIYFDFNAPIVTNTTLNSILDISTGIQTLEESNLSIYPNPTNGFFTIELSTKAKQLVQLFDIAGNVVLSQTIENGSATIDASHLAAGIYNINIKGENSVTNKKLVIVK
ncbi:MAG: T9SS type A sorting domain-containing protein [Bacteroidota bacterium]